jgi:ankyrin repeat protein
MVGCAKPPPTLQNVANMNLSDDSPFYRLLATRYDADREAEAIAILEGHPELARLEWAGSNGDAQPFVAGSTALHYAANDGKLSLVRKLIEFGADVNASNAQWYRSVLAWAANNARVETIKLLLAYGARPDSLDAMHAAAWGGSDQGKGHEREYAETLKVLVDAGADVNDRRHCKNQTPLAVALASGNRGAIEYLRSVGASEE